MTTVDSLTQAHPPSSRISHKAREIKAVKEATVVIVRLKADCLETRQRGAEYATLYL